MFRSRSRNPEPKETFTSFGKTILNDESTADFVLRCNTREFKVHKTILCARSAVLRAIILSDTKEGKKGEIFVEGIDEKTLDCIIDFIYTGELDLEEEFDVQRLIWAGNGYLLPGFMEVLCSKMRWKVSLTGEMLAGLLISAQLHGSSLKEVALERVKANRGLLKEEGFKKVMKEEDPSLCRDAMLYIMQNYD